MASKIAFSKSFFSSFFMFMLYPHMTFLGNRKTDSERNPFFESIDNQDTSIRLRIILDRTYLQHTAYARTHFPLPSHSPNPDFSVYAVHELSVRFGSDPSEQSLQRVTSVQPVSLYPGSHVALIG